MKFENTVKIINLAKNLDSNYGIILKDTDIISTYFYLKSSRNEFSSLELSKAKKIIENKFIMLKAIRNQYEYLIEKEIDIINSFSNLREYMKIQHLWSNSDFGSNLGIKTSEKAFNSILNKINQNKEISCTYSDVFWNRYRNKLKTLIKICQELDK